MSVVSKIDLNRLPLHIAIIMDGNGRWAKLHGEQRIYGHQHGVHAVREATEACAELGVKYLTLYAFSTENWARPVNEVDALMELLVKTISAEMHTLMENQVKLSAIGDLEKLPKNCHLELKEAMQATRSNTGLTLILALNYSSRWEITNAIRKIVTDVKNEKLNPSSIDEGTISEYLQTRQIPDPELLIRTSGEQRLSNFLLWQAAYAELHFSPVLWPDFTRQYLYEAILDFQNRERRFGKTSEQVQVK
jgi:undecaprenyl diphosphate synthase